MNDSTDAIKRKAEGKAPKNNPSLRLFTCATCGHKIRFGAARCGQCWQAAPLYNQTRFYVGLAAVVALGSLYVFLSFYHG
jgi:hypothetical protein